MKRYLIMPESDYAARLRAAKKPPTNNVISLPRRKRPTKLVVPQSDPDAAPAERLAYANRLVKKGKTAETIAWATQLPLEKAQEIVEAEKERLSRQSQREILQDQLNRILGMIPKAEEMFHENPTQSYSNSMATLINQSQQLLADLRKLAKPENMGLRVLKTALQPFVNYILQDITRDLVRARDSCRAVCTSPKQRKEVDRAFQSFGLAIGKTVEERYAETCEHVAIAMECDLEELKKLAVASRKHT